MQFQKTYFNVGESSAQMAVSSTATPSAALRIVSPKSLSNEALLRNTQTLVTEERRLTTEILWHLHEIQVRRLYAEKGYGSLFEYAVQTLGYSEAAAGRRIAAMRLLVDVPEIEPALKDGSVSLSTLSTIQAFVQRREEPFQTWKNATLFLLFKANPVANAKSISLLLIRSPLFLLKRNEWSALLKLRFALSRTMSSYKSYKRFGNWMGMSLLAHLIWSFFIASRIWH